MANFDLWNPQQPKAPAPPPDLDVKKMEGEVASVYQSMGEHRLLNDKTVTEDDRQRLQGATIRNSDPTVKSVCDALTILGTPEAQKSVAELQRRVAETGVVGRFEVAHLDMAKNYALTGLARREHTWSLAQGHIRAIKGRYDEEITKPSPDAKVVAAYRIIESAQETEADKLKAKQKAEESARSEGNQDAQTLGGRIRELQLALDNQDQVVAALKARIVELEARPGSPPVPAVKAAPAPNARQQPR